MNKIIEEQLKKVVFADLSNYNENTNTFIIPKYSKPSFEIGKCYLVKVAGRIINNNISSLATNWNNGTSPKAEYYKVYVSKIMGKMLYLDCLEYDYQNKKDLTGMFSGWFELDDLTQLNKL